VRGAIDGVLTSIVSPAGVSLPSEREELAANANIFMGPAATAPGAIAINVSSAGPRPFALLSQTLRDRFKKSLSNAPCISDGHYILPYASERFGVCGAQERYSIVDKLPQAIESSAHRAFVILADSGMGKTTLGLKLCDYFWRQLASKPRGRVPLYIHLPQYVTESKLSRRLLDDYFEEFLGNPEERIQIKQQPLLLILDGYDEITDRHNIYTVNQWGRPGYDIKMVTTCRPEVLRDSEKDALFEVSGTYQTHYLQAFDEQQVQAYLTQFIKNPTPEFRARYENSVWLESPAIYNHWLERLPTLKKLAETPFLLTLIVRTLPAVVEAYCDKDELTRSRLSQTDVFELFTQDWFKKQTRRLKSNGQLSFLSEEQCVGYLKAYAQNLAARLIESDGGINQALLDDTVTLDVRLLEPTRDTTLLDSYISTHRAHFITHSDNIKSVRSGCLFSTEGGKFRFLHKSLVEFLAARKLFEGLYSEYDLYLNQALAESASTRSGLNRQLIKDIGLIARLVERIKAEPEFHDLLLRIIMGSKDTPGLSIMAANAITFLNAAGTSFSGYDFSDIQIPGANLKYAMCEHTNFQGADLSGVNFSNSWLRNAHLNGAKCSNLILGERPCIKHQTNVTAIIFYKNYWLIGCEDGYVYQWDVETYKLLRNYAHKSSLFSNLSEAIKCMAISISDKVLITAKGAFIWLWSLETGQLKQKITADYANILLYVSLKSSMFVSQEGTIVKLRHLADGKEFKRVDGMLGRPHAISITDKWLATYSSNSIELWDLSEQVKPIHQLRIKLVYSNNRKYVKCESSINFSSSGDWLVFGDAVGMQLWNLLDGRETVRNSGCASSVVFSPQSNWLVSGNNIDNTIQLWRMPDLILASVFCNYGNISCLVFDTQGSWLASASGHSMLTWGMPSPNETFHASVNPYKTTFPEPNKSSIFPCQSTNSVMSAPIMFSPDGRWLVLKSGELFSLPSMIPNFKCSSREVFDISNDWVVAICSARDQEVQLFGILDDRVKFLSIGDHSLNRACFSPEGNWLALVSEVDIKLYHLQREETREFSYTFYCNSRLSAFLSFDNFLILGCRGVRVWNIQQCIVEETIAFEATRQHFHIHINRDNDCIIWERVDHDIEICNYSTKKTTILRDFLKKNESYSKIIFSHKDDIFAYSENNYTIKLYEISGKCITQLELWFIITGLRFAKNNFTLAVSGSSGFALIYFDSQDMKQWRLLFSSIYPPSPLNVDGINVTQVVNMPEVAHRLCKQRNVIGSPASGHQTYIARCTLFQPIPGTAVLNHTSLLHGPNHLPLAEDHWVVSVARKKATSGGLLSFFSISRDTKVHTYLIIEGIKHNRRFIIKADLTNREKQVIIDLKPLCEKDSIIGIAELKISAANYECQQWEVVALTGETLLSNIRADQQKTFSYNQTDSSTDKEYQSCVSWCKRQLRLINITFSECWYNLFVELPSDITVTRNAD
jgi:WD40 repeat protein